MTYLLPPLNPLRAFEAAARHLSFKLAANELHVTPGAVGQHVKTLEDRLGVRLFERPHKQLILTAAGQEYLAAVQKGFYRIADATERTQIWMVTHSQPLAAALAEHAGVRPLHIIKRDGETWIEGLKLDGGFRDDDE